MKVAAILIVKGSEDEAVHLERCLQNVHKSVDGIFLNINAKPGQKPSEKVLEVAEKYTKNIITTEWHNDFAEARNANLAQVPKEYEWCLWLDTDDTIDKPKKIKEVAEESKNYDSVYVDYLYEKDEEGNPLTVHMVARMFKNNGSHQWKGSIHETLIETRGVTQGATKDFTVVHHADADRRDASFERNIKMLEAQLEAEAKDPDPRTFYYLASTYMDAGAKDAAKLMFEDYLRLSGWDQERSAAFVKLGRIYLEDGNRAEAKRCFMQAIGEDPENPEPRVEMGSLEVEMKQYGKAVNWLTSVEKMEKSMTTLERNPMSYTFRTYLLLAEAYLSIGGAKLKDAAKYAVKARKYKKQNKDVVEYTEMIEKLYADKQELEAIITRYKKFKDKGQKDKAQKVLDTIPEHLADNVVVAALRKENQSFKWPKKSIAIMTGDTALDAWGPWSLKEGIGGSEEAIIRLSKRLAEEGWKVVVFAKPGTNTGLDENGVMWRNYWDCNLDDEFDIFVAWRAPFIFDKKIKARKSYLWLHDVMEGGEFTPQRIANFTKCIVLSKYHRGLFPMIPEDKILMSGNGIDPEEFEAYDNKLERDPHKILYASSHVRGLAYLYEIWPEVKKAVPDATLDVYYGRGSYDAVHKGNPERMKWMDDMEQKAKDLDGVTDHGKASQEEIVREGFRSGLWAYPCPFPEIYCHPAGTKVMTEFGEKNIEELLLTDKVLTHRGVLKPIYQTMRRKAGKLIRLNVRSGDDLLLTPNHPVYTKREGKYEWVNAEDLTTEDHLLTPAELLNTDYGWVNCERFQIKDDNKYKQNNLPTEQHKLAEYLKITPEFAKFLGYFAGDGNANERGKVSVLVADKHPEHEKTVLDGFKHIGLVPDVAQKQGCKEYRVYNYELARAFRKFFYDGKKKKLPIWLANWGEALDGLMEADGHVKNGYNYSFTNTSERLIGWFKIALAIRGYSGKAQERTHNNGNKSWTISWTQEGKLPQYTKQGWPLQFIEKKIKSIETIEHNDWVYNIEVEDDHSYVSNGSVVHNCITAIKSQASGAVPVSSTTAALDETVQFGHKQEFGEFDEADLEKYKESLIWWLQHPEEQEKIRADMMAWSRTQSWEGVAKQWSTEFQS